MAANVQDVIMCFGDSITQGGWEPGMQGFGAQLAHRYARKLDVLNRGLSGYNTDWATPAFKQCLATTNDENVPKIRLLTIWFGANDACIWPSPQHVSLSKFVSNLRDWIDLVHSPDSHHYSPDTRIILISPPPVNTYQRREDLQSRDPPKSLDRDFETTKKYAEGVREVAEEKQVGFTDVWTILWEASGKDEQSLSRFLYDGLHLNGEGYKLTFDALMQTIQDKYPELHFDNLPPTFPPWLSYAEG
ncbi:putative GDSL-like Lipase/Acylhydrolase family protein [Lyophyllum shimeji]|uniref:GDSL-like Lipase/Acylhydrolase family protein n=1 Tax=Lyophyllum shimeji TaxID=47721 RepID=A0A9P3PG28_LYOSH|nr:putative GDSL-like Lipase/Acylhydrolase family protein [Lyophyllum shimeji]